jgi:UDP-hydrolysing UDP-N-acetyl-D-glucosamine 2-epimerase
MPAKRSTRRHRVLVITGSRSEFGLLRPVMHAIAQHHALRLGVCVAGEHFVARTDTVVQREFRVDYAVKMQRSTDRTRIDHARAFAQGVSAFAEILAQDKPDWLVVLGDRIEAFAAASAAAVAGVPICHIHGGDRAEGIADDAMRHAISKLAHLHCPATASSARRLVRMGEDPARVIRTGSPSLDDILPHQWNVRIRRNAAPGVMAAVLLHPGGLDGQEAEVARAAVVASRRFVASCKAASADDLRTCVLLPNSDPGSYAIGLAYRALAREIANPAEVEFSPKHWDRHQFLDLLARLRGSGGVLIGNSSAGLIEAAAIGVPVVNIGQRQRGREMPSNVVQCDTLTTRAILSAVKRATARVPRPDTRYGDGRAGARIAALLARGPDHFGGTRKINAY